MEGILVNVGWFLAGAGLSAIGTTYYLKDKLAGMPDGLQDMEADADDLLEQSQKMMKELDSLAGEEDE